MRLVPTSLLLFRLIGAQAANSFLRWIEAEATTLLLTYFCGLEHRQVDKLRQARGFKTSQTMGIIVYVLSITALGASVFQEVPVRLVYHKYS